MIKENILVFIELCKAFELNLTAAQITKKTTEAFAKFNLFAELLPKSEVLRIREMLSTLSNDPELFQLRRRQCAVMLICMSEQRKAKIAVVQDAPKENGQIDYVCISCGYMVKSVNTPVNQNCCATERYIKA